MPIDRFFIVSGTHHRRNVFIMAGDVVARRCSGPVFTCEQVPIKPPLEIVLWYVVSRAKFAQCGFSSFYDCRCRSSLLVGIKHITKIPN